MHSREEVPRECKTRERRRGSLISCYCNKKSNLGFGLIYLSLDDTVILDEEKRSLGRGITLWLFCNHS